MVAFTDIFQQDTFVRANQSGWGSASAGGTWTSLLGSPTQSIASDEGHATGIASDFLLVLGSTTTKDVEAVVRLTNSDFGNNASGIYLRAADANNFYRCMLGEGEFFIDKKSAGTFTSGIAQTSASPTNGTYYQIRVHIEGTSLYARYWQDGTTEPTSWTLTVTDSDVSAAGYVGVGSYQNATGDTVDYDHFTAYVPYVQMLYNDVQTQYAAIRAVPSLVSKVAFMAKSYFPPTKVLDEAAVPGEIDVLLNGETWSQLHELATVPQVNLFIAKNS